MSRELFYKSIKAQKLFPGGINNNQVAGIERLLNAWFLLLPNDPANHLAYNLATSFWETGKRMQPVLEIGGRAYFEKYEPGTKIGKMLGNVFPGDGFKYRGAGDVQNTGRRNAAFSSRKINERFELDTDFVNFPEQRLDPLYSAACLFLGNREGWWTGRDLFDFIDNVDEDDAEDLREFTKSRAVVNGTDKALEIAKIALKFEKAIQAAGGVNSLDIGAPWPTTAEPAPAPVTPPTVAPEVPPAVSEPKERWWVKLIEVLFGGK